MYFFKGKLVYADYLEARMNPKCSIIYFYKPICKTRIVAWNRHSWLIPPIQIYTYTNLNYEPHHRLNSITSRLLHFRKIRNELGKSNLKDSLLGALLHDLPPLHRPTTHRRKKWDASSGWSFCSNFAWGWWPPGRHTPL